MLRICAVLALLAAVAQPAAAGVGQDIFNNQCASCHSLNGISTPSGPSLKGVVWRKIADRPDFAYSPALKALVGTWTPDRLDAYLKDAQAVAPGTSMFWIMSEREKRRAIIDYLQTVK